jgi:hypothetical protein
VVEKLVALGLTNKEANASLNKRRKQFNNALKEYSKIGTSETRKGRPKSRKNSINDVKHQNCNLKRLLGPLKQKRDSQKLCH